MERGVDIAGISIPFAAGVIAGNVLIGFVCGHNLLGINILASTSLLTAVIMAISLLRWRCGGITIAALFFTAGLFTSSSHSMTLSSSGQAEHTVHALESLQAAIASIPFREERTGALLTALLTGDRSLLGQDTVNAFRDSGASHILALSGLHLGIIHFLLHKILGTMGNAGAMRIIRAAGTVAACIFYTLMAGAGPSLVRACLFIAITEISSLFPERRTSPAGTLLCVLTIQLALKPESVAELGFQLSYLAMCGIILVFPKMKGWYPAEGFRMDPFRKMWEGISLSASCQLFTAPLVWMRFHTFPEYFMLTNLIAMPLTSLTMTAAVGTLLLNFAGICPHGLVRLTEVFAGALMESLELISGL